MTATITGKVQATLPKRVREALGVGTADKVAFVILEEGRVEVRPVKYTIGSLNGIIKTPPGLNTDDLDELFDQAFQQRMDQLTRRAAE
jgi:AbrB family looped-hinge helix DNA binding protein